MSKLSKKDRTITIRPDIADRLVESMEKDQQMKNSFKHTTDNLGIEYIHVDGQLAQAVIPCKIRLHAELFELFKELSYRDGFDKMDKLDAHQIDSFVKKAVIEKIDRCLQDYQKLQRKHNHLVTLKAIPDIHQFGGERRTKLVPKDYEEYRPEYAGFD